MWFGQTIPTVFAYGAISEHCMEKQLEDLKGCKRQTTFMSDFSIGEWCTGVRGLFETIENGFLSWCYDERYMAEFILCINWKAWEHDARGNKVWAALYSLLFEQIRDLLYDYYEGDDKKTSYVWRYLD